MNLLVPKDRMHRHNPTKPQEYRLYKPSQKGLGVHTEERLRNQSSGLLRAFPPKRFSSTAKRFKTSNTICR
jgi:hypothetical protein